MKRVWLALALAAAAPQIAATHISKPIITTQKLAYAPGETLIVKGWVAYQDKPAPDVLLEIRLASPSGAELLRRQVRSDPAGNFALEYRLATNAAAGEYPLEVTSHCNDAHRPLCTRQRNELRITVKAGAR